ncbi:MAG: outer membrane lipoprotein-sorting protein [Gemmatimonadota bacterium]
MLRKDMGDGLQRYYMYFHRPADVRGTAFLVWAHPQADDERWVYMPALDLVRGIAARDSRASFVGSDFNYEDISGRDVDADEHTVLGEESVADRPAWKVESRPRGDAGYDRKIIWIDKVTALPLREEYYGVRNELYRVFTADEIRDVDSESGTVPTVVRRTMTNVKSGHRTEVTFIDIAYDAGLTDEVFTEDALRRPPRRWIR